MKGACILASILVGLLSLAGAQEVDCPIGAVIRSEPIEGPQHISPDPSLPSQPLYIGRGGTVEAYVTILSQLPATGPRPGIQGYIVAASVEGNLTVVDVTDEGTAGDEVPEGIRRIPSFAYVDRIDPQRESQGEGFYLSHVFGLLEFVSLPPTSAADVGRVTLAAPDLTAPPSGRIVFRDGLIGFGAPIENSFTVNAETHYAGPPDDRLRCLHGTTIGPPTFRRGDADGNGRLELTDGVHIHRYLFAGEPRRLGCPDAADVDDDGAINLTDGIRVFLYLFRNGDEPPPPFDDCGADPTHDGLTCAAFTPCTTEGS